MSANKPTAMITSTLDTTLFTSSITGEKEEVDVGRGYQDGGIRYVIRQQLRTLTTTFGESLDLLFSPDTMINSSSSP